jgi:3'-5' exonuclease
MQRTIFIDIETLPALNNSTSGSTASSAEAPLDENHLKMALNGDFGRLLCIGFIDELPRGEVERGVLGWDSQRGTFHGDERQMLVEFWCRMKTFRPQLDRIVGHNIFDFDLRFILKRSVVHGVRPTVSLSFARYRNQPIFDTMHEWERWSFGAKPSLDTLARVLNLESSKQAGVNGSQIFQLFQAGQMQVIRDYCAKDVELTRAIYQRMVFAAAAPELPARRVTAAVAGGSHAV